MLEEKNQRTNVEGLFTLKKGPLPWGANPLFQYDDFKGNVFATNSSWNFLGTCLYHWYVRTGDNVTQKSRRVNARIQYDNTQKNLTLSFDTRQFIFSDNEIEILYDSKQEIRAVLTLVKKKSSSKESEIECSEKETKVIYDLDRGTETTVTIIEEVYSQKRTLTLNANGLFQC
ncbi:hypothetical protein [uncultured Desulfobacter sp.]|uniref:hypothetical protein n=1 Tax=uncultured Desulfobacter sp. TaxID=240139 RepID=UPI002AAAF364|nr:hypothetical protein [uncultured Desulfobacter sp.]